MSLSAGAAWFISISGLILLTFERVEKYSSEADLELYYLLLTVKRPAGTHPWHAALSSFFDSIFGEGWTSGPLYAPLWSRVALFSLVVHLAILLLILAGDNFDHARGWFFIAATAFLANLPCDYITFAKTRTFIKAFPNHPSPLRALLYFSGDIALLLVIISLSMALWGGLQAFFLHAAPNLTAWLLRLQPVIENGQIDWEETFYQVRLTGMPTILVLVLIDSVSAFVSTAVFGVFMLSVYASYARQFIPRLQAFLDDHTAVRKKPLQILGLFAVVGFAIIFWSGYLLLWLIDGNPMLIVLYLMRFVMIPLQLLRSVGL
jgi:hypothetical protein